MFGVSCNRLLELLRTEAKSDIVSEKMDYPAPEKTKWYTTVSLILLTFVIVAGLLMFAKKPSIEPLLMIIVGVALAVLVIRVFVARALPLVIAVTEQDQKASYSLSDLLKASWMRSSIKLALIATVAGVIVLWLLKVFNIAGTQLFSDTGAFFANYGLAGIFLITIAAGTILPLGSPAFVVAAALFCVNPILLILVATTGFTIGMTINYGLAYRLGRPYVQKRISAERLEEMTHIWNKWGWIIYVIFGLIPVLPVELLAFICGFLKTRIATFLALSFVPRLITFAILVYFGQYAGAWLGVT
jgi:membrane protein YqaA with SNARE-associated domain